MRFLKVGCSDNEAADHLLHVFYLPWVFHLQTIAAGKDVFDLVKHSAIISVDYAGGMLGRLVDWICDHDAQFAVRMKLCTIIGGHSGRRCGTGHFP